MHHDYFEWAPCIETFGFFAKCEQCTHSGPKTPKSKPWGESPNFIWQMKEGYIRISRSKIFFKSVEGKF